MQHLKMITINQMYITIHQFQTITQILNQLKIAHNQVIVLAQQTHVVSGNDNLYRIAIQYYGEGTVENVNKLKRANGLTNNNIVNGQN